MDTPASLENIKYEQRLDHFTKEFGSVIEVQKQRLRDGQGFSPAFVCDGLLSMLVYTCKDLSDHNEVVAPEDVRRISSYYFIELINKIFGKNLETPQGWVGVDHLSLLYYSMLTATRSQMGAYNINYLLERNKALEAERKKKAEIAAAEKAASELAAGVERSASNPQASSSAATTPKEVTKQVNNELMEMSQTEVIKPVATSKTRQRLAGLLGFGKKKSKEDKKDDKATLKQSVPLDLSQFSKSDSSASDAIPSSLTQSQSIANEEIV